MGGLRGPAQASHRCTKCNSPSINGQCTNHNDGPLFGGFNVAIKGLNFIFCQRTTFSWRPACTVKNIQHSDSDSELPLFCERRCRCRCNWCDNVVVTVVPSRRCLQRISAFYRRRVSSCRSAAFMTCVGGVDTTAQRSADAGWYVTRITQYLFLPPSIVRSHLLQLYTTSRSIANLTIIWLHLMF